jgi:diadenylate cyclase
MFEHFGIKDFVDIFLVALLLFYLYNIVKVSGIRPLFIGILVFLIIWVLVSQVFNMVLLGTILDQLVSVGLFLLVILFQDEIRRFLMSLGSKKGWKFISKLFFPNNKQKQDNSHLTAVVLACMNMAKSYTGALIVIQGDIQLGLYEQTGEIINADVSSRLIESIFFKNSPLHDGAMIIVGKKLGQPAVFYPCRKTPIFPNILG